MWVGLALEGWGGAARKKAEAPNEWVQASQGTDARNIQDGAWHTGTGLRFPCTRDSRDDPRAGVLLSGGVLV